MIIIRQNLTRRVLDKLLSRITMKESTVSRKEGTKDEKDLSPTSGRHRFHSDGKRHYLKSGRSASRRRIASTSSSESAAEPNLTTDFTPLSANSTGSFSFSIRYVSGMSVRPSK
nr:MAG TPA: hypothetical protein [Caudoviricetes sp.]